MYRSIKVSFKNKTAIDTVQDTYVADSSFTNDWNFLDGSIKTSINAAIAHNESTLAAKIAPKVEDGVVTYDMNNIIAVGSELTDAYSDASTGILVTNMDSLKDAVYTHLNDKIGDVIDISTNYYTSELSAKNTYKDSQMAVKGSKSVAEAMDVFARVVSDAITFGDDYAGYNGRVQGVSFGDDTYAPALNSINTTTAAIDFVPGNYADVFFDKYARVYYVVDSGTKKRIVHKALNYTVRFAGLGKTELGGNNYIIYPSDDLKYASGSSLVEGNKVSLPTTTNVTLGTPTTYTLLEATSFSGSSGMFYVPKVGNGGDGNFYVFVNDVAVSGGKPIYKKNGTNYDLVQGEGNHYAEFLDGTHYIGNGTGYSGTLSNNFNYFFVPIMQGYKAELILTDSTSPTYDANNDVKIYRDSVTDSYYVFQSQNKAKLIDHTNFTDLEENPGYFLLYTRYGQPVRTVPGTTGGVMTKEQLLLADSYYWTGEEISVSGVPANMTAIARS